MKKILLLTILSLLLPAWASEESEIIRLNSIQSRIDRVGTKILNSNKLQSRVVFVYNEKQKQNFLNDTKTITKREVVVYGQGYKNIQSDDELAAYLSREIASAIRSYDGLGKGWMSSVKMKAAPKKYELVFDKIAVDYMVKAGYNPLGLIVYINKTCPQARQDKISAKNLTSKRLAHIYERIYFNYPTYIVNNTYLNNEYYQNFLLTSQNNRRKLEEKVANKNYKQVIKYE